MLSDFHLGMDEPAGRKGRTGHLGRSYPHYSDYSTQVTYTKPIKLQLCYLLHPSDTPIKLKRKRSHIINCCAGEKEEGDS